MRLLRTLLFAPGNHPRMVEKIGQRLLVAAACLDQKAQV